jgi:hypothetical protein
MNQARSNPGTATINTLTKAQSELLFPAIYIQPHIPQSSQSKTLSPSIQPKLDFGSNAPSKKRYQDSPTFGKINALAAILLGALFPEPLSFVASALHVRR